MFSELFSAADRYLQKSDWRDLTLIKFCMAAIGLLLGLSIPKEKRKLPAILAVLVFIATYIPLMVKFFSVLLESAEEPAADPDVIL